MTNNNNKPKCTEYADGSKEWFVNGKRHRTDGPAIEWAGGSKEWFVNNELHRTDGPAIEWVNGTKEWYVNDKRHRTDGPAIEHANGSKHWFVNGKQVFNQYHVIDLVTNKTIHKTFDQEEANRVWIDHIKQKQCVWIEERMIEKK